MTETTLPTTTHTLPAVGLAPLKIALVTATFPPYHGGTGKVCYHNALELARRGHQVQVFTASVAGAPAFEECEGFTVHRLKPLIRVGNAPVLPGLLPALKGFDLIHLHCPFFGGELTTLAAALSKTPLVITYHQDVFLSGLTGLIEQIMRRTVGRLTLRHADRLLFTSLDYTAASYVRPMLKGRETHIAALSNGVDTTVFTPGPVPAEIASRHPQLANLKQIVLLVAGLDRAHYFKGVNVLLEALARLPQEVGAVIVGDGDLRPEYEATAARLGLSGRVIFAGRVSDTDLPHYYRLADLTVLPSVTMGEAFGLVLVESLACGTPVIASNLPGVRTVVESSYGRLVEPNAVAELAQTLEALLSNPEQLLEMGRAGRAAVTQKYDWSQIGARLENIYAEVLQARGKVVAQC